MKIRTLLSRAAATIFMAVSATVVSLFCSLDSPPRVPGKMGLVAIFAAFLIVSIPFAGYIIGRGWRRWNDV